MKKTASPVVRMFILGLFVIGFLAFLVLPVTTDPARNQGNPLTVAKNFVSYLELGDMNKANELTTSSLRDNPQWSIALRQLSQNIDPKNVQYKEVSQNNNQASVQFYSNPPITLNLKNNNGKWEIVQPSQSQQ